MKTGLQPRKPPRKIGRPCKLTPELQSRFCAAVAKGLPFVHACAYVGISVDCFEEWRLRGENGEDTFVGFVGAVKTAEAEAIAKRCAIIDNAAASAPQHWTAAAWMLERRYPEHFGRKDELRNTGNTPQTIINVVLRSPEELAQLERELRLLDQQQRLLPPGQTPEQQSQ